MRLRCDNCGRVWDMSECNDARNLALRLEPGGVYTDKECPECGALCYPMPGMKLRWQLRGAHIWAAVFMGPDVAHLACVGKLTLRPEEWEKLKETLTRGNEPQHCEMHFEEIRDGMDLP